MTQRDPFEDYRKRREIELMEHDFQEKSGEKRQRLEDREVRARPDLAIQPISADRLRRIRHLSEDITRGTSRR